MNIRKMNSEARVACAFTVILLCLSVVSIYPLIFALQTSFKTSKEFYADIFALPSKLNLNNYVQAFITGQIGDYFVNSVVIAVCSILGIQVISIAAAYALSRLKIPHPDWIIVALLAIQLLPKETLIIPLYVMMSRMGIMRTVYVPIILAYIGWSIPGTTIILKNYFQTIPSELMEAARIDGSGEVNTMLKIVFPLMKGAISTCVVMNFNFVWGELMWARIATLLVNKGIPLTVGLLNFKGEYGTNWPLMCAAICIIIVPLYLLFLFLQKYFIAGLTAGGVKG